MLLVITSFLSASAASSDVVYELHSDSGLGQSDCRGNAIEVPLGGTFSIAFSQSEMGVGGRISDIDFQSVSGPAYHVKGGGGYGIMLTDPYLPEFPAPHAMDIYV